MPEWIQRHLREAFLCKDVDQIIFINKYLESHIAENSKEEYYYDEQLYL